MGAPFKVQVAADHTLAKVLQATHDVLVGALLERICQCPDKVEILFDHSPVLLERMCQ